MAIGCCQWGGACHSDVGDSVCTGYQGSTGSPEPDGRRLTSQQAPAPQCFTFPASRDADGNLTDQSQSQRPVQGYSYTSTNPITQGGGTPSDRTYAQCHILMPTLPPSPPPSASPSPPPPPPPSYASPPPPSYASPPASPNGAVDTESKPCFARSTTTACRLLDAAVSASAAFATCFGGDDGHEQHGAPATASSAVGSAVAERVPMASLVAGDLVLASPHATTRVLVNQHRAVSMSSAKAAPMVTISHAGGGTLTLTPDHMLLIDGAFRPARDAKPGSRLEPASSVVTAVAATTDAIVNPLTASSTILAAGATGAPVVASCLPEWVAGVLVDSAIFPLPFVLSPVAARIFPAAAQAFYDDVLEDLFDVTVPRLERLNAAAPLPLAVGGMVCADVMMVAGLAAWSAASVEGLVAATSVAVVAAMASLRLPARKA